MKERKGSTEDKTEVEEVSPSEREVEIDTKADSCEVPGKASTAGNKSTPTTTGFSSSSHREVGMDLIDPDTVPEEACAASDGNVTTTADLPSFSHKEVRTAPTNWISILMTSRSSRIKSSGACRGRNKMKRSKNKVVENVCNKSKNPQRSLLEFAFTNASTGGLLKEIDVAADTGEEPEETNNKKDGMSGCSNACETNSRVTLNLHELFSTPPLCYRYPS